MDTIKSVRLTQANREELHNRIVREVVSDAEWDDLITRWDTVCNTLTMDIHEAADDFTLHNEIEGLAVSLEDTFKQLIATVQFDRMAYRRTDSIRDHLGYGYEDLFEPSETFVVNLPMTVREFAIAWDIDLPSDEEMERVEQGYSAYYDLSVDTR